MGPVGGRCCSRCNIRGSSQPSYRGRGQREHQRATGVPLALKTSSSTTSKKHSTTTAYQRHKHHHQHRHRSDGLVQHLLETDRGKLSVRHVNLVVLQPSIDVVLQKAQPRCEGQCSAANGAAKMRGPETRKIKVAELRVTSSFSSSRSSDQV